MKPGARVRVVSKTWHWYDWEGTITETRPGGFHVRLDNGVVSLFFAHELELV